MPKSSTSPLVEVHSERALHITERSVAGYEEQLPVDRALIYQSAEIIRLIEVDILVLREVVEDALLA